MPVRAFADSASVSAQIRSVADAPGMSTRSVELKNLADALEGKHGSAIDAWTDLDLLQAYARPESFSFANGVDSAGRRTWLWLEAGLGALVFVPILLTWLGLTKASDAYVQLAESNPDMQTRPFLQLWQTGFGGEGTGWFTFGHVAATATGAIALLLALTIVHGASRAASERRRAAAEHASELLMRRLVPLLTEAQLILNARRLSSPARFAEELSFAAGNLGRLNNKAVAAQKNILSAVSTLQNAVESADRRFADVHTAVRPLEEATTRIETAVRSNGEEMSKALQNATAVTGEVRDSLRQAGERIEDSVHTLAAAQRSFTSATEVAMDVSARVIGRLGEITGVASDGQSQQDEQPQQEDRLRTDEELDLMSSEEESERTPAEVR